MRGQGRGAGPLILVATLAVAGTARAAAPPSAKPAPAPASAPATTTSGGTTTAAARRHQSEQLFRAGERAFKANKFAMAAQMFEQAYQVLPLPAIAFSAAQAYRLQYAVDQDPRKLKRAVDLYQLYVDHDSKGNRVGDAARSLAELRPILAATEKRSGAIAAIPTAAPASRLMVNTSADVPGARVSIDGGAPEALPLMRQVKPGRHRIHITARGYFPFDAQRDVVDGQIRTLEAQLRPQPAVVTVATADGAEVALDGRPVGVTPLVRPLEVSAGTHLITVTLRGHRAFAREVKLERGQRLAFNAPLERTRQRVASYWVLGASAALVLGAGVTAGLSISAGSSASQLEDKRQKQGLTTVELARYQDDVSRRDDRLRDTWILLGVGGAVAATGALLYFMDNPRADSDAVQRLPPAQRFTLTPVAAPDGTSLGLALLGRF